MVQTDPEAIRAEPPFRQRIVVDTSIFTNPDSQAYFGQSIEASITGFLHQARSRGVDIYLPLSVFRELATFASEPSLHSFKQLAVVKAPALHTLQVPAAIFHTFISDLRQRVNKGLDIAEKAISRDNKPENIRWVRQQYREALRSGIIDSVEDLEVVLLAKEVEAAVLTADQGIANMAEELGIEVFSAKDFFHCCFPDEEDAFDAGEKT